MAQRKLSRRKIVIFSRILLMTSIIVLLTVFLVSGFASGVILDNAYNSSQSIMQQLQVSMSFLMEISSRFTLEISNDSLITPLLYTSAPPTYGVMPALSRMNSYLFMIAHAESIYIFNKNSQTVYLSVQSPSVSLSNQVMPFEDFPDTGALELFYNYQQYPYSYPILRAYTLDGETRNVFTFFSSDWQGRDEGLTYAVMINLSPDYFSTIMASLQSLWAGSQAFIYSRDGYLVSTQPRADGATEELAPDSERIWARVDEGMLNGSFVSEADDQFVIYAVDESCEWGYVLRIPNATLLSSLKAMQNYTIRIALIALLLSILLSIWTTIRFSKPLDAAENQLLALSMQLDEATNSVARDIVHRLIQAPPDEDLIKKLQSLPQDKRPVVLEGWYALSIISLDDYQQQYASLGKALSSRRLRETAQALISLLPAQITGASIIHESKRILLLASSSELDAESGFAEQLESAQRKLIRQGHGISVMLGATAHSLADIHASYLHLNMMSHQRIFYGEQSFVPLSSMAESRQHKYTYPQAKSKQMVSEIMKGNAEGAYAIYREIVEESRGYTFSDFNAALSHLFLTLSIVAQKSAGESVKIDNAIVSDLQRYDSLDAMNQEFRALIDSLCGVMRDRKSSSKERLIASIDQILETQYSDSLLGIDTIAGRLDMSANYIGRMYKQATTVTITDRLLEIRMQHALRLLEETDLTVSAIAAKVGFASDSYFYKLFKQVNHTPPADYRLRAKQHRP